MTKEPQIPMRLMKDREYALIPVDKIIVVNPRNREKKQFQENVRSIADLGLIKPIRVNKRRFAETGKYELICGQGRLEAHIQLGIPEIKAEVVDEDEGTAYLCSLIENLARSQPGTIEFARALMAMYEQGMTYAELAKITDRSESGMVRYIRLMKNGEERLIRGVEEGVFSITFAFEVANCHDKSIQEILMDAFDEGIANSNNLKVIRKILESRKRDIANGAKLKDHRTVDDLKESIREITDKKRTFCTQVKKKENRLIQSLLTLKKLDSDQVFSQMIEKYGIKVIPELKGRYNI
jgi:ParB family chromosome partitioning protein